VEAIPVYQTEFEVKCRISGTAKNLSMTLEKPDGGTMQGNPSLASLTKIARDGTAAVLTFTYHEGGVAYLSIQNQDDSR
jgi:hypothetical protein